MSDTLGYADDGVRPDFYSHFFGMRMQELDDEDAGWHVHRAAGRSADDEFGGTVLADMLLLQVALIAIALFTFISISNWQDGCVGSRFLLTVGGGRLTPLLPIYTMIDMHKLLNSSIKIASLVFYLQETY